MITLDQAYAAVARIAATTNGWSDAAVDAYAHELAATCTNPDALAAAAQLIVRTWTNERARPTVAVLLDQYHRQARRLLSDERALPQVTGPALDPSDGRRVAYEAYAAAVRERGHDPNPARFERLVGLIES